MNKMPSKQFAKKEIFKTEKSNCGLMLMIRPDEYIVINENTAIQYCNKRGNNIWLRVVAPKDVPVSRNDLKKSIKDIEAEVKAEK